MRSNENPNGHETMMKSLYDALNPNAAPFYPQGLNPNATPFIPTGSLEEGLTENGTKFTPTSLQSNNLNNPGLGDFIRRNKQEIHKINKLDIRRVEKGITSAHLNAIKNSFHPDITIYISHDYPTSKLQKLYETFKTQKICSFVKTEKGIEIATLGPITPNNPAVIISDASQANNRKRVAPKTTQSILDSGKNNNANLLLQQAPKQANWANGITQPQQRNSNQNISTQHSSFKK